MTELKIGERNAEVDCDRSQTRVCMGLVRVKNWVWCKEGGYLYHSGRNDGV